MNLLTITVAIALTAGATPPATTSGAPAAGEDVAQVYSAFMDKWNGPEHHKINVSKSAALPTVEEVSGFTQCVKAGGNTEISWEKAAAIADLSGTLGNPGNINFVDPKTWHPQDPGELIAKGQSVEKAVDAGFAAGLLTLSAISFDQAHTTAAFTYSFVCGSLCGNGASVVFTKTAEGWKPAAYSCDSWISDQRKPGRPEA